jgi:hypothetical protein
MIVGRSASERWSTYIERDKIKKKVRQVGGANQIRRVDGDGYSEYSPMSKGELRAHDKLVDLAVKIGARAKTKTQ